MFSTTRVLKSFERMKSSSIIRSARYRTCNTYLSKSIRGIFAVDESWNLKVKTRVELMSEVSQQSNKMNGISWPYNLKASNLVGRT